MLLSILIYIFFYNLISKKHFGLLFSFLCCEMRSHENLFIDLLIMRVQMLLMVLIFIYRLTA